MEGSVSVRSVFHALRKDLSTLQVEAIELKLKETFEEKAHFDICNIRDIISIITGVHRYSVCSKRLDTLRPFHCVDYAKLRHVTKDDLFKESIYAIAEQVHVSNKTRMSNSVEEIMDDLFYGDNTEPAYQTNSSEGTVVDGEFTEEKEPSVEDLKMLGHADIEEQKEKPKKSFFKDMFRRWP